MASSDLRDELSCSICLNVYTDPVNLRCGHNFCRECITLVLDKQRGSGTYSCPDCRATSKKRPPLQKNIALSNITRRLQSHQTRRVVFGVTCTYCVHSLVPAVKSCVLCEASLCDDHLRVHSKAAEHVLTEPTTNLESRKCSVHKKILEYYCTEDSTCICVSCCLVGEHKGHQIETLDETSRKKKQKLKNIMETLNTKTKEIDERIQNLQEHMRRLKGKATYMEERVNLLFTDVKRQLEVLQKSILCNISWKLQFALSSVSEMVQELEIRKADLAWKTGYLEELYNMTDPLPILQMPDGESIIPGGVVDHEDNEVQEIRDLDVCHISKNIQTRIQDTIKNINVWLFMEDPIDLQLDVNTSATNVRISEDQRTVTWSETVQNLPETPQRFEEYQVLSLRSFSSGRHYWKMETSKDGVWRFGVCYPSMDRKGKESIIGNNKKSWCLSKLIRHAVVHEHQVDKLRINIESHKYGIYLDYEGGQLSFYELGDYIKHLHTFTATFTEPLHPAFHVSYDLLHCIFGDNLESEVWIRTGNCVG
ncbi:E3 ubiquitin-protein ligase TRIM39-like [Leptodactylus fuscus]|uniref:E3 ubiquitin-protein ligase TRIM39-like n=1 Tax=Leptodactylus fuscus TaxID=238119 RepID=UPI003F4E5EC2